MDAVQTAESSVRQPPSFETVWAILQEVAESQKESDRRAKESREEYNRQREEYDRKIKESREEYDRQREDFDRQLKKSREDYDRQVKDFNRRFGDFSNRFGEVVEYMIAPNLREKFQELGLIFPAAYTNSDIRDHENNIFLEVDVKLENGDKAMLVEVKTKLTTEDVKEHIERLEKMRRYADLHGDKRTFLGAVAGVVMTSNVKDYALKQGFFVIEPSGETMCITPPHNKPKEW